MYISNFVPPNSAYDLCKINRQIRSLTKKIFHPIRRYCLCLIKFFSTNEKTKKKIKCKVTQQYRIIDARVPKKISAPYLPIPHTVNLITLPIEPPLFSSPLTYYAPQPEYARELLFHVIKLELRFHSVIPGEASLLRRSSRVCFCVCMRGFIRFSVVRWDSSPGTTPITANVEDYIRVSCSCSWGGKSALAGSLFSFGLFCGLGLPRICWLKTL